MKEQETLVEAYQIAKNLDSNTVLAIIKQDVDILIAKIGSNESLVSALIISLVKKICEPSQDIRLHRTDFENGYSARVLDTQITYPFFKDNFPKYANKESSFLTLATRERIKWTKDNILKSEIKN
jgi:DNA (cytosine-5)-methyltransferase 1